jgi:hypothetical protein
MLPPSAASSSSFPAPSGASFETVRRETGKEYEVEVLCSEGVASHTGPEPCGGVREGMAEASAGECIGQPLSRDRRIIPGADAVVSAEGNTQLRVNASAGATRRGRRPWHVRTLLVREPGDLTSGRRLRMLAVRIGKARSRSR